MSHKKESYWRRHIQKRREAGISAYKYCKLQGISYSTYQRWEKNLKIDFPKPVQIELPLSQSSRNAPAITMETRNLKITLPVSIGESVLTALIKELAACS